MRSVLTVALLLCCSAAQGQVLGNTRGTDWDIERQGQECFGTKYHWFLAYSEIDLSNREPYTYHLQARQIMADGTRGNWLTIDTQQCGDADMDVILQSIEFGWDGLSYDVQIHAVPSDGTGPIVNRLVNAMPPPPTE